MLNNKEYQASIKEINGNLIISNGLIERVFKEGTTVRLNNLMTGEGMLRSVRPEAEMLLAEGHHSRCDRREPLSVEEV